MLPQYVIAFALGATVTAASPLVARQGTGSCKINKRKAWHTISNGEKKAYLDAELCLMNSNSRLGLEFTDSLWQDVIWTHVAQTEVVHGVGAFLPWHRWYVQVHERLLQTRCNYRGAQPYWDEIHDIDNLAGSEIFDPTYGFGGPGAECLTDGPFADITVRITASETNATGCLYRNLNTDTWKWGVQAKLDDCHSRATYAEFRPCTESNAHAAGHGGVGGLLNDPTASPNDPIFFLHHAYVDKLWWEWQQAKLPDRLADIGGPNVPSVEFREQFHLEEPGAAFTDYFGYEGSETVLEHNLWMVGVAEEEYYDCGYDGFAQ